MKLSTLKASVTVPVVVKKFALLVAILDTLYSVDREKLIRQLVFWYKVQL